MVGEVVKEMIFRRKNPELEVKKAQLFKKMDKALAKTQEVNQVLEANGITLRISRATGRK